MAPVNQLAQETCFQIVLRQKKTVKRNRLAGKLLGGEHVRKYSEDSYGHCCKFLNETVRKRENVQLLSSLI